MIETISLLPGVTLRCFRDSRFKQGGLSVQFLRTLDRQEAGLNALLPAVLLRGCETAPDLRAITLRLDDLYGASVGELVRKSGDYQTTGLICGFISDRYALDGDRILEPMVAFLEELLLKPVTEKGVFSTAFVESEKKNQISAIESKRNNKRAYATKRLLEIMCREDTFSIPRLGDVEAVKAITAEGLWAHYQKVLRESPVELFYVGEADPGYVAQLLRPVFEKIPRQVGILPAQTLLQGGGAGETEETMEVEQARLNIGWRTEIHCRESRFAAMKVCNHIFGGGMTAKLFMNVRERMSLCYDISSAYHGSKGIVTAAAGIDYAKAETVKKEIFTQLQAICDGQISQEELQAAKEALCNALRGVHDSPGAIESYYGSGILSGNELTPAEYKAAVEAVTAEQVAEVARTLVLDTVYILRGVQ